MSKVFSVYHIVINTYCRRMTIPSSQKRALYSYINAIAINKGCKVLRINGTDNHIHILVKLAPTVALSSLVQEVKRCSSMWMHNNPNFQMFESWGKDYFAMSINPSIMESVEKYIDGQESHHTRRKLEEELKEMCLRMGIEWRDCFLADD